MPLLPAWVPPWVPGAILMIAAAAVVLMLYRWFVGRLARLVGRRSPFLSGFLTRSRRPLGALAVILALGAALPGAQFPPPATIVIGHLLLIALVLALGWAAGAALNSATEVYLRRFHTEVADNLLARKHVTQVNILRRTAQTVLVILTVATALMTIAEVRQYGVSLLASAGAAGIVVGLAARPVLTNLLAGIQIAITQPIRVEDAVIVQGEWGWIEEITSTYVVVRIWDLRRMIVPLTYFTENPFQNWTYSSTELMGAVLFNTDYTVPVEALRKRLEEIVQASKLWDGKVALLQVTDTPANMVQLRALVSARNSGDLWDLRCEVREKLIAFLQQNYPQALPRQREEMVGGVIPVAAPPAGGRPPR
jgi:small-conductance mechanosensitive channel